MTGRVFNIQRFSTHDGPGIRTTVFLKGCTLRCPWCHNPESWLPGTEVAFQAELCRACGECIAACPNGAHRRSSQGGVEFDRGRCRACGRCAEACPSGALQVIGREMQAEEVGEIVARDIAYYRNSGGGVTLSGGEPLLQPGFAREILGLARRNGIHAALDTAGHVPWEDFDAVLPLVDLVLLDLKVMDPVLHRRLTGVSNERVLQNASLLSARIFAQGGAWIVRLPVIPGVNDSPENAERTAAFLAALPAPPTRVELLPFHELGAAKSVNLGREPPPRYRIAEGAGEREVLDRIAEILRAHGVPAGRPD